ncbi:MAG: DUF2723 domain-containing protein [candidate division WOR-3 bacterium]|nr:DUF2723 domain-containing protein [candidate division WOR-3 bacterium]
MIYLYFFIIFLILFSTLSPTVGLIDSGEIIFSIHYLNILHPTGYPLFTLLGKVFFLLPFSEPAFKGNLFSFLVGFGAIILLYFLIKEITKDKIVSLIYLTLFSFSNLFWSIVNEIEVYSLTTFFLILLIYLFLKREKNNFLFIAYILGIALTHHLMLLSIILPIFFYFILKRKKLLPFIFLFLLGISLYFYLLIRANSEPLFNWGNPKDILRLFWHISGRQYRVWSFSLPFNEVIKNFLSEISFLIKEMLYLYFFLAILGIYLLLKKNLELAIILILTISIGILNSINYSIPDIQPYYLPAFIPLIIFSSYGFLNIKIFSKKIIKLAFFFITFLILLIFNYQKNNKRDFYLAYDFVYNILKSLPENSLILTDWWDFYSPSLYFRYLKNFRKDLIIIDKELLRRTFYLDYLRKVYPDLTNRVKKELEEYEKYLYQFEYNRLKDNFGIQRAYINLLYSFIENKKERAYLIYLNLNDYDLKSVLLNKKLVPYFLALQIKDTLEYEYYEFKNFRYRKPNKILDERENLILDYYIKMINANIYFLEKIGEKEKIKEIREILKKF